MGLKESESQPGTVASGLELDLLLSLSLCNQFHVS